MFIGETKNRSTDVEVLIREVFHLTKTQFWINRNDLINDKRALRRFTGLRARLLKDEPLAYILGRKEAFSRDFIVNRHVLIPRPETEILIGAGVDFLKAITQPAVVLDIGSGSGVIAISLALETGAKAIAVEKSRGALSVLRKNIALHHIEDNVFPVHADLFPRSGKTGEALFDVIVSNPPYVAEAEWPDLPPCVRNYEPKQALVAANEGLSVIERIAAKAREYLKPAGKVLVEIGAGQKEKVEKIFDAAGFGCIEFLNDYSRIPRVVSAVA
jgi:release factor glutamine methyltransferase